MTTSVPRRRTARCAARRRPATGDRDGRLASGGRLICPPASTAASRPAHPANCSADGLTTAASRPRRLGGGWLDRLSEALQRACPQWLPRQRRGRRAGRGRGRKRCARPAPAVRRRPAPRTLRVRPACRRAPLVPRASASEPDARGVGRGSRSRRWWLNRQPAELALARHAVVELQRGRQTSPTPSQTTAAARPPTARPIWRCVPASSAGSPLCESRVPTPAAASSDIVRASSAASS